MKKNTLEIGFAKKIIFSLIVLALFLGCTELILFVIGTKSKTYTEDPYVGFHSGVKLFQKETDSLGKEWYVTSPQKLTHFNPQKFSVHKDPQTFRIFTLGGSTTYGHPYVDSVSYSRWLREYLPLVAPQVKIEVINAGGISYASYREVKLMEELVEYQPNLFIVYTGHNEFLEDRTYSKLRRIPGFLLYLDQLLSHTRIYTWISTQFFPSNENQKTQLDSEVNTVLEHSIGPQSYKRDDEHQRAVLEHFKISLTRMNQISQNSGAHLLLVSSPSNLKDCEPFKDEINTSLSPVTLEELTQIQGSIKLAIQNTDTAQLQALIVQLNKIPHRSAKLYYLLGQAYEKMGDLSSAEIAFIKSRDEDVCPLRAITGINQAIEKVAENEKVPFLPWQEILKEYSQEKFQQPILGDAVFLDHVHPTIDAHQYLAQKLLEKILQQNWVKATVNPDPSLFSEVYTKILSRFSAKDHALAFHNIAKVYNWGGKHRDAIKIAKKALLLDTISLEAINSALIVGTSFHRESKLDSALYLYQLALRRDPNNTEALEYSRLILVEQGKWALAQPILEKLLLIHPGDLKIFRDLVAAYLHNKQPEKALPILQSLNQQYPSSGKIAFDLAEAYEMLDQKEKSRVYYQSAFNAGYRHEKLAKKLARP